MKVWVASLTIPNTRSPQYVAAPKELRIPVDAGPALLPDEYHCEMALARATNARGGPTRVGRRRYECLWHARIHDLCEMLGAEPTINGNSAAARRRR